MYTIVFSHSRADVFSKQALNPVYTVYATCQEPNGRQLVNIVKYLGAEDPDITRPLHKIHQCDQKYNCKWMVLWACQNYWRQYSIYRSLLCSQLVSTASKWGKHKLPGLSLKVQYYSLVIIGYNILCIHWITTVLFCLELELCMPPLKIVFAYCFFHECLTWTVQCDACVCTVVVFTFICRTWYVFLCSH